MTTETRIHGYARVSSKEQNEARQIAALKEAGVAERDIYMDKVSGKNFDRPEYQRLMNVIRKGDLIVILSLDRLGRNYTEVQAQWKYITNELGADIQVLDMPLLDTRANKDTIDSRFVSDLVLQILSYVAAKERENIKARQAQGIANAKAIGKHLGRPRAERPEQWDEIYSQWRDKKITAKAAMKILDLKPNTFYKFVNEEKENE
ncbi:MAG TPA: recombinase family protein [Candidatus Onthovicinus excrementipullorum]|nr:recombinase family protein [Candidatus Onthovicinus excrementipullorum]